jgi:predicted enzyme involved in methoxymalonyl-ACP biosynthesis
MSCRVLGRTVEERLLDYMAEKARLANVETLFASHVPTKKNAPFADFYPKNGFVEAEIAQGGEKSYALRLASVKPREAFVELIEGEGT